MPVLDHFSLIAPYYDRIFHRHSIDGLWRRVSPEPGCRLLDVGGGTGWTAQHFVGAAGHVCVVDPSPRMVQETRLKEICIAQGEAEHLPYPSGLFERVIMVDAFHHLCDQSAAIGELMRVLAPGGRLVIEEPDASRTVVRLVALFEKLLLMRSHFVQPKVIAELFEAHARSVRVDREGHACWIVVEKAPGGGDPGSDGRQSAHRAPGRPRSTESTEGRRL